MTHFTKTYSDTSRRQERPEALDLAHALISRICHDLISPLGAIGNGIELLGMTRGGGDEIDLMAESIATAHARIRLFRNAFGAAQPDQMMSEAETASLMKDHARTARYLVDFAIPGDLPRQDIRLLMLVLMCLDSTLPWGGMVQIRQSGNGYHIAAETERHRLEPELWAWPAERIMPPDISPATVHFALLALILPRQGWRMQMTSTDHALTITLEAAR